MSFLSKVGSYFTKKVIIWLVIGVVVIGGGVAYFNRAPAAPIYDTVAVARRDLIEEVDVTGHVQPAEEVSLAFESSGKVAVVNADVGDVVQKGQVIAALGSAELSAQLASARASAASAQSVLKEYQSALAAEQARLDELKLGTRPEELAVSETKVSNAQQSLTDAISNQQAVAESGKQELANLYLGVSDVLRDAYTKCDDAIIKYTDEMFSKDYVNKNELVFIVQDQSKKAQVQNSRDAAMAATETFGRRLASIPTDQNQLDTFLKDALGYVSTVQSFLTDLNDALNDAVGISATTLSTYKSNVSAARSNLVTASSGINKQIQAISAQRASNSQANTSAQNQVNDAKNALDLAKNQLALEQSGTLPDQIRQQEAKVQQASLTVGTQKARVQQALAEVQRVSAQFGNFVIVSPIKGIVTRQDAKVGQIVTANQTLMTVISQAAFEIVANVPEADIAKIHVADAATLTLDAYPDTVVFDASVVSIDPAQIAIEGVPTYKVTLQFAKEDERIRSGMTANLTMKTDKRDQVLAIPQRSVISRNGDRYVQRIDGGKPVEVPVTLGLYSTDGYVEIVSGLNEGDEVVLSARANS